MPGWIKLLSKREDDWDGCRSVLEGHTYYVKAVAFSSDDHQLRRLLLPRWNFDFNAGY